LSPSLSTLFSKLDALEGNRLLRACRKHLHGLTSPEVGSNPARVTNLAKFAPKLCKSRKESRVGFHNSSFDPQTLVLLETAFDEAWLTLKSVGNKTVKPDELARSVLRTAMEGERDPVRLHDGALERLLPATTWREAS
jgi:hypothetical protein